MIPQNGATSRVWIGNPQWELYGIIRTTSTMVKYTYKLTIIIAVSLIFSGCSNRPFIEFSNESGRDIVLVTNKRIRLKSGESTQFLWRMFKVEIERVSYDYKFTKLPSRNFIRKAKERSVIRLVLKPDRTMEVVNLKGERLPQPEGFPLKPKKAIP